MVRRRGFDEQAVLDTAISLFWRKGFQRTSMCDLAQATGVQRGSLYHAYGDKETLFLMAFEAYAARFLADAGAALQSGSLQERLTAFFDAAIANMRKGEPAQGCLSTRVIMEVAEENESARRTLRDLLNRLEAKLEAMLAEAKALEEFDGDPRQTARLLVVMTRGLAVVERAYGEEARLRAVAREAVRLISARA